MSANDWTRNQLLLAFAFYCCTPYGKLHKDNPKVIALAQKIGRTPSAVAMKLGNFASIDPTQQARQIRGLRNASRADRQIWDEFIANPDQLAFESQQVLLSIDEQKVDTVGTDEPLPNGPTESTGTIRTRLVQSFFRDAVLSSYEFKCAICSLDLRELLNASHIIPWSVCVERRADPRNGLSLCAIHDRAFDRGLLSLDESYRVVLSSRARLHRSESRLHLVALIELEGRTIWLPKRFAPDPEALAYHREYVFKP